MGKPVLMLLAIFSLSTMGCKENTDKQVRDSGTIETRNLETIEESSENYLKAWSTLDTSLVKEIAIRNFVRNVNGEITSSDQNGLILKMIYWHTGLPDFKVVSNEIVIQGNRSFIHWTSTGTNTGMLGEMTPTGKKSETEGFSILTFDNIGQLIHENTFFNMLSVMEDWGYTLLPPHME